MTIIKLNAIDSTNSFLKKLLSEKELTDYTTVVADIQLKGRGQMGTSWESDSSKNLTISVLKQFEMFRIEEQFYLSMTVALAVLTTVKDYVKLPIKVKWPNDILAGQDKLAGILIENIVNGSHIRSVIIGIGLNVNQVKFSNDLMHVTSLKAINCEDFDRDVILQKLLLNIKYFMQFIERKEFNILKKKYLKELYKFEVPSMFETSNKEQFMGRIIDISSHGQLIILLENEKTCKFSLKEIKFASR